MTSTGNSDGIDLLQKVSIHERSLLSIVNVLSERSKSKKHNPIDCEELAKSVYKTAARCRRATSLSSEVFAESSMEYATRASEIQQMKARIELNNSMMKQAEQENESIKQLIEFLNGQ